MDKLICVGKNYIEHARELQTLIGDKVPTLPVLFLKPPGVLLIATSAPGQPLRAPYPVGRGALHHECEIAVRLGRDVRTIDAVTLGLDMTLRDEQSQQKKAGNPWEISKVFAGSAILGPWIPVRDFGDYLRTPFTLSVDGKPRQKGMGSDMRLFPEQCIEYAAKYFPLFTGDVILTGTPAGVGPVTAGQTAELRWGEKLTYSVRWE